MNATQHLFTYGTLRLKDVQIELFGRELEGRDDVIEGYTLGIVPTENPGESYGNLIPSSNPDEAVLGTVVDVTDADLLAADRYEAGAGYWRIDVTLRSGLHAWVYLRP